MLYSKKSKKKSVNFSEAEINFLNNFSSVAELNQFAVNFGETLDKVNDYIMANRWVGPAAGVVGGAGIGALGGLALGDKKKSKLERALLGAGIGAGVGGLGGLGASELNRHIAKQGLLKQLAEATDGHKYPKPIIDRLAALNMALPEEEVKSLLAGWTENGAPMTTVSPNQ